MSSRIGELNLRLRIPGALEHRAAELRMAVERRFAIAIVEELERRLHAALGADVVIRVRRLALRWTLDAGSLDDAAVQARLADELARDLLAEIAAQPAADRLRPRSAAIVVFADSHHAAAAWLADVADGQRGLWCHEGAPDAETTWNALVSSGPGALQNVLRWLERMERVVEALELAPDAALDPISAAVPAHAGSVALVQSRRAARSSATASGVGIPAATVGADAASAEVPPLASAAPRPIDAPAIATHMPMPDAMASGHDPRAVPNPALPAALPRPSIVSEAASTPMPTPSTPPPTMATGVDSTAALDAPGRAALTRYAGLFYLVGRVLEIDLAAALWATGVAEDAVLAWVAATIVGDDEDAAPRWFGGSFDHMPQLPVLPAWACDEVSEALQHGLGLRLVAFGIARTPAALAADLDGLATSVPRRIAGDPASARVVARAAAALALLVAARLRRPASWQLLRETVTRTGRLIATADALHVIMGADQVDIEHRRAGLDHNPGYVAWLGRRVLLEFVGSEAL